MSEYKLSVRMDLQGNAHAVMLVDELDNVVTGDDGQPIEISGIEFASITLQPITAKPILNIESDLFDVKIIRPRADLSSPPIAAIGYPEREELEQTPQRRTLSDPPVRKKTQEGY